MKKKLLLSYILIIAASIFFTGIFSFWIIQRFYRFEVQNWLLTDAKLVASSIAESRSDGRKPDYNRLSAHYASILSIPSTFWDKNPKLQRIRVTFVDMNGKVLGDSDANYAEMENHAYRPEIQAAMAGEIGSSLRYSSTLKVDQLYIAVPVNTPADPVIVRLSYPLIQIYHVQRAIFYYFLFVLISGIAITVILAFRLTLYITGPINKLIGAVQNITKGDYTEHVQVDSPGEVQQLAEAFNHMVYRLRNTMADLTDKNLKVESIIDSMINGIVAVDTQYRIVLINSIACDTFRINQENIIGKRIIEVLRNTHINGYLRETIEKNATLVNEITISAPEEKILRVHTSPIKPNLAGQLNSGAILFVQDITSIKKMELIRTEFVSNVTHELKTPLTSIRGFIETLRSGAIHDRDVAEKFLQIIDIESERLYMLINDILQLSEIESKGKDSNISLHKVEPIVAEVMSMLEGQGDKKSVTLSFEVESNLTILANRDRIKQMLINLVENGIKYNVEGGSVFVNAHKAEGMITFIVRDTGIGIAQEHISRVFERFYRVDKGRSRNSGGTGLGLSIVKHIVNLYSGDIKVNSQVGKGTEFIVRLPV